MNRIEWSWYMPMSGDGEYVGMDFPERYPNIDYLVQVARTAEESGFDTILLPTQLFNNTYSEDAPYMDTWTVASAVGVLTERIRLLIAVKTGETDPVRLAKMGATLDQMTNGRMVFNITTGGSTQTRFGVTLGHDERYERTEEVMEILKGLWTNDRFSYKGKYYFVENAVSSPKPVQKPYPPFYYAGVSEAAKKIAARLADVQLIRGDIPERVAHEIEDLERRVQERGRRIRYGVRLNVIVRESEADAWASAEKLLSKVNPEVLRQREALRQVSDSVQQGKIWSYLAKQDVIGPNLWTGLAKVRGGQGTVLVGTPDQIADRLMEYVELGVSLFILAGYPQVEECRRVGEWVLPLVNSRVKATA